MDAKRDSSSRLFFLLSFIYVTSFVASCDDKSEKSSRSTNRSAASDAFDSQAGSSGEIKSGSKETQQTQTNSNDKSMVQETPQSQTVTEGKSPEQENPPIPEPSSSNSSSQKTSPTPKPPVTKEPAPTPTSVVVAKDTMKTDGRFLYDSCGEKVILRGYNHMTCWTDWEGTPRDGLPVFSEMAKTGANVVRIVWINKEGTTVSQLDAAITNA
ncbi:MAG: hypothetical protein HQK54_15210, partial [Oligoflexales bacterium]|nr:hypothetical protein [Oligoflexales bacterium]